jgi:hypothetical protein
MHGRQQQTQQRTNPSVIKTGIKIVATAYDPVSNRTINIPNMAKKRVPPTTNATSIDTDAPITAVR